MVTAWVMIVTVCSLAFGGTCEKRQAISEIVRVYKTQEACYNALDKTRPQSEGPTLIVLSARCEKADSR